MKKKILLLPIASLLIGCTNNNSTNNKTTYIEDDRMNYIAQGNNSYEFNNFNDMREHVNSNIACYNTNSLIILNPENIINEYDSLDYIQTYWSYFNIYYDSENDNRSSVSVNEHFCLYDEQLNPWMLRQFVNFSLVISCVLYPCTNNGEFSFKSELISTVSFRTIININDDLAGYVYVSSSNDESIETNIKYVENYLRNNLLIIKRSNTDGH